MIRRPSSIASLRALLNRKSAGSVQKISASRRADASRSLKKTSSGRALDTLVRKQTTAGLHSVLTDPKRGRGNGAEASGSVFTADRRREQGGSFDHRQLESSIDRLVASSLMHGRQTSSILRSVFGLVPSLIGR